MAKGGGTRVWQPALRLLCSACHRAAVAVALEQVREAQKVEELFPPSPALTSSPSHLCSLFQEEEEWIQRLTGAALTAEAALCFPLNRS